MKYSDNAMSAILLTSHISLGDESGLKPFTMKEWNHFLELVQAARVEPGAALSNDFEGDKLFASSAGMWERIRGLLTRGGSVALELEELEKKGIGIITPFDTGYPVLLERRLQKKAPPVLFYAGNLDLAGKVGIAVAGSRNVDKEGINFSRQLAQKASEEKLVIYSGGAKGVDFISEQTAIHSGGAAVSYIADSLLTRIRRKENLDALMSGKLLLLSDVNPGMGFSVARAMSRNKYIYSSSCGAFVIESDYGKGGTWAGATEAIRNGWTNVYVWENESYKGNLGLIEKGAIPYQLSEAKLMDILSAKESLRKQDKREKEPTYEQLSFF